MVFSRSRELIESTESKQHFEKEAGILNKVEGHRNISRFLRFYLLPYAFVLEYSCLDYDVWLVSFSPKRD